MYCITMLDSGQSYMTEDVPDKYLTNVTDGIVSVVNMGDYTFYDILTESWIPMPDIDLEPDDSHNEGF